MTRSAIKGLALTVNGAIRPEQLGVTMMHEHLFIDLGRIYVPPDDPEDLVLAEAPLGLNNLSFVSLNYSQNRDNLVLSDPETAVAEARLFSRAGGGTIVDVTNVGLGRDPVALQSVSRATGLNVIMGCSYYHALFHPADMDEMSEDDIANEIVRDIEVGVDGTDIRAGIIGEVGCSWPLRPNEAKVLRASAQAQRVTGAPISIHPGRHVDSPFEIVDILFAAGAAPERIIMGHMERTNLPPAELVRFARTGCYLEYDWFGEVRPTFPYGLVEVPSDSDRIKTLASLIDGGFGRKILVSQDVCFKTRLASFGGPGYAHIARYVTRWMRELGIGAAQIDDILVHNPREILQFA